MDGRMPLCEAEGQRADWKELVYSCLGF